MEKCMLKMEHITKRFHGVTALDDVSFEVEKGEIHALVGENGAAKALNKKAKLIILDEPTASLTEIEVGILMGILKELKRDGTTCIYISHKLNEVIQIADSVTVLRDGQTIVTKGISEVNEEKLISYMVGRELVQRFPHQAHTRREKILETHRWTVMNTKQPGKKLVDDVNISVYRGEILGIAGLMGAGRTEFALSLFGMLKAESPNQITGASYPNGDRLCVRRQKAIRPNIIA